jgi:hypothetical protein
MPRSYRRSTMWIGWDFKFMTLLFNWISSFDIFPSRYSDYINYITSNLSIGAILKNRPQRSRGMHKKKINLMDSFPFTRIGIDLTDKDCLIIIIFNDRIQSENVIEFVPVMKMHCCN